MPSAPTVTSAPFSIMTLLLIKPRAQWGVYLVEKGAGRLAGIMPGTAPHSTASSLQVLAQKALAFLPPA